MGNSRDKFLDLATDCFGEDIEKKHSARGLLDGCLLESGGGFDKANAQLISSARWPRWLMPVIYTTLIFAGLLIIIFSAHQIYKMRGVIAGNTMLGIPVPAREYDPWSFYFKDLSAEDKLLLFGDTSQPDESGRREGFWRSEPDNVGAYVEYLSAHRMDHDYFPDDMLQVAEKIDPDNALFLLFLAGELTDDCTKKVRATSPRSPRRSRGRRRSTPVPAAPAPVVKRAHVAITDVEKHREALVLLHRAAELPMCSAYGSDMMKRRLPLLDRGDYDWVTRTLPVIYLASQPTHCMPLMKTSRLIEAEAYRCEQVKDAEALKQLVHDWKRLCRHLHGSSQTLIDALVLRAFIHAPCKDFAEAAKACGLSDIERYYAALDQQFIDERDTRSQNARNSEWDDNLRKNGGLLSSMSLPILDKQVNDASSIPLPDLRPDRLADHAFWNRIMSAVHWGLLPLFSLVAWIYSFRSNVLVRKMSHRLTSVFGLRDWGFVIVFGIILPVVIYWLVNGAGTVMSVQNWGLGYMAMLLPAGQSGSLMLLLLFAPMLAISHRINKSIPFSECTTTRLLWAATVLVILAMPVFGLAGALDGYVEGLVKLGFGMQGVAVLLLLATPVIEFIRIRRGGNVLFGRSICHNLLVPAYMVASLVMALHIPVYHTLEKHWVATDEIFKLSPEYTSFTWHETLVTKQLLSELDQLVKQLEAEGE